MRRGSCIQLTPLDLPLALFLLSAVIAVWPAYDRSQCWNTLIVLTTGFLLYVLISRLTVSRRWWRVVASFIVLMGLLLSFYFVTQYPHLDSEKIGVISRLGAFLGRFMPRVGDWTPMANSVATFLEGLIFLAAGLAFTARRRVWRVAGTGGVVLMALALLMSASRGAWLGVAITSMLWVALYWRPARWGIVMVVVLVAGLVVHVVIRGDITALNDIPVVSRTLAPLFIRPDRLDVYRNSVYLIQDFPLTGIGLGKQLFAMVLSRYALLIQVPFLTYSHNLYLEIWLEQGLLGITAWLWLMTTLYITALTYAKTGADMLYQSTWLGLTANLLHGITDARQYIDLWCWLPFFVLLGLNGAIVARRTSGIALGRRRSISLGSAGTVMAFLIVVLIGLRPLSATWHANRGCILQARGDLLEALSEGQRIVLLREAKDLYRRAIQIAPLDRTAQQRLGLMLVSEAQFQEAVGHLEMAWQADPNNTTTHKGLGLAYVWVGELEKARLLLQDVPDIVPELNTWGWWRSTQHQMEQSINAYRTSLLLEPDQPRVRERIEQLEEERDE